MMEEEGTSKDAKKRKKRSSTIRKITIKDFPLGEIQEPYNLIENVCSQGTNGEYSHYEGDGLHRSQEG